MSMRLGQKIWKIFCKNSDAIRSEIKITFIQRLLGSMVSQMGARNEKSCLWWSVNLTCGDLTCTEKDWETKAEETSHQKTGWGWRRVQDYWNCNPPSLWGDFSWEKLLLGGNPQQRLCKHLPEVHLPGESSSARGKPCCERRIHHVGSQIWNPTAREPPWKQNRPPSMVHIT